MPAGKGGNDTLLPGCRKQRRRPPEPRGRLYYNIVKNSFLFDFEIYILVLLPGFIAEKREIRPEHSLKLQAIPG